MATHFAARVIGTFGRRALVEDGAGRHWQAVTRGKRGDLVVGDLADCTTTSDAEAVIDTVAPRRTLLWRSDGVRTKELAANVDQVAIVFASRPAFQRWFLWKALVAAAAAGIGALVVRNKCDLTAGADEAAAAVAQLEALGVQTLQVSATATPQAARAALAAHCDGRATLLVGQSGMGKSTLLNLLVPDAQARTREFSERLNQGKQTTTASRWFQYRADSAVVDTPGFHQFGLAHVALADVARAFPEWAALAGQCRFLDCRHLHEPDCAVRAAVADGRIGADRYGLWTALVQERAR